MQKITDPFYTIDFDTWNRSAMSIIKDEKLTSKQQAIQLRALKVPIKPDPVRKTLQELLVIAETLHQRDIANSIRKEIIARSDKHIGYLITVTLKTNDDFVLLRQFCDKFTKSKFYRESSKTALRYELTDDTKLVHVHIYVENPARLQVAQLRKRFKTIGLPEDRYNLDLLPVNRNNGMEKYVNKCMSYEKYKAYCIKAKKEYDPERVDDVQKFYKQKGL